MIINNQLLIVSVPNELNTDHEVLLSIAQEYGFISELLVCSKEKWSVDRYQLVLQPLLRDGMVWVDDGDGVGVERRYMFPSLWMENH